MFERFVEKFIIAPLIKRERKRQIKLGYTQKHDLEMVQADSGHLILQAEIHFERHQHYIQALALLQANEEIQNIIYPNH